MRDDPFLTLAKSIMGNCEPAPTNEEMALRTLAALVSIAQSLSQMQPEEASR